MSGVPKIQISESLETLQNLMKEQKTSLNYAKVQALYLLKVRAVETVRHLAVVLGRGEATIHRWLKLYREGGVDELLMERKKTGRPKKISVETAANIQQELKDPEGFSSYKEVRVWLWAIQGITLSYITVYKFIRYELKAKLKVPRLKHYKQIAGAVETFKQLLPQMLKNLKKRGLRESSKWQKFSYWCEDETRLGLRTIERRKLTLFGVKPIGLMQEEFEYYYVYGLISPDSGRSFFYEFSHLDTVCFEKFLQLFSQAYPEEFHILQVDSAPWHISKALNIPTNILLLFQPTYSPEVNPIERLWEWIKECLGWQLFDSLEELRKRVRNILESLTEETLKSLSGWEYIETALSLSLL
jgi:transposase